ncbi:TonB-dependent receptor plug domain-containing protein [Roseomonas sp. BN140053]|uniref:TonB-dependent receptor plug domain-containing protein n=1 Tax=Roseomonas sp. BN140053 TaxID=3391898 RepID=UPI0039EB33E2
MFPQRPAPRPLLGAALLAALLAARLAAPAAAQDVDRGALEELFGEPVTTSASGKPQRASDVPVAMDIITAEQIRRSGAHDIPAVLARYTSLDVQQYNAHDYSVGVRGYATPMTQRLLVLVNGRQVYLDHYGYVAWDSIPVQLTEIRQIEVVKGPNSALFGFNALAGVVNIITFDPAHDRVSNGVVRLGTGGYREASGVVTAPFGPERGSGGVRLSAGLRGEHSWSRGFTEFETQELDARRSPTRAQFAAEAKFRVTDNVRVGLDGSFSRAIGGDFMDYGQVWREDKRAWSLRGQVSADTGIGLVEAQVYHTAFRAGYAATAFPTRHSVTVAELSDTVKLGASHTLRPFAEFRHTTMSMIPGTEVSYNIAAGGLMWNWAITDRLESTAALRYDQLWLGASGYDDPAFPYGDRDYDRSLGTPTWNFGLVWRVTDADTLRVGAARGVSLPSLSDLGWRDSYPGFGYQDSGNPRLSPTVVNDYQLEYRRRLEVIDGQAGITGFFQRNHGFSSGLSAVAFSPPEVPYDTYSPYNLGRSDVVGLDVSLAGRVSRAVDWGVQYRLAAVSGELRPSLMDYKGASPRHLVLARIGWTQGPLEANLFGRYASRARGFRTVNDVDSVLVEVRDYASVAARLGYRLTEGMALALEGENLLHQRQEQTFALKAERRVYLSLRVDF